MASEQETEFTELCGFLQDQKPEVRRFAAEGVLSQTEDTDFLDFCRRQPRTCARPLLRLAEKAEADRAEALRLGDAAASASGASGSKGDRAAALAAASTLAAGVAALKALVNLSAVPAVAEELVALNAPKRVVEALRAGWLEGRAEMAHWFAMLLANVSTCKKGQEALVADESMLKFLVAAYVTKPRLPPRDGYEDPLQWLGKTLVNLLVLAEGRRLLGKAQELQILFSELSERLRRVDMSQAVKNVCLDMECHEAIVATDLLSQLVRFLCPWEKMSAESRAVLPDSLKELTKDASLTSDLGIRSACAVALMGLCRSELGRSYLRPGTEVFRCWQEQEPDAAVQDHLAVVMPGLLLTEEELKEEEKKLQELFFISSNDDYEGYRYAGLEVGHVFSTEETLYQLGAGNNDPQFAPQIGLDLLSEQDNSENLVTLQDGSTRLQMRMMGGEYSTAKISRGNQLSLWLEPLTVWTLPETCGDQSDLSVAAGSIRIHCFVIFGTFRRCGEVDLCSGKKVVPHADQVPMMSIEMPDNMNDLFGPLIYEMDIYNLKLPAAGALPHRLMVQIAKDDGTKPHFRVATGRYYNAPTREFATIGRVLTSAEAGMEPFEGVPSHVLYVMLQLAVSLRGYDRTRAEPDVRPGSYFKIRAPPGFQMLQAEPVLHEGGGLGMVTLSPDGDAASRLNGTSIQPAPTGFGTPDLRGWEMDGQEAIYTLLDRAYIPAMSSLVMGLRVYPGNTSLPITNTLNLWSVQVFSPGDHNVTIANFSAKFYRTGLGGVPVLGRLEDALIQPMDPRLSAETTEQQLSIFFKAVEDVPAGGSVDVEAGFAVRNDAGPRRGFQAARRPPRSAGLGLGEA
ncbi:unnamed protein product [Effrenium voratum]|nr:unnamed protein product [Effrenium voratum]